MASYPDLYRPASRQVDVKSHKWFDDEEASVLDEGILDSGVETHDIFSPNTAGGGEWTNFDQDVLSASASTNPFYRHNNPFAFDPPAKSWDSGSCTPTAVYDAFAAKLKNPANFPHRASNNSTSQDAALGEEQSVFEADQAQGSSSGPSTNASLPTSPLSNEDWSAPIQGDHSESRSLPKRFRLGSPLHSHSHLLRRDGIRKKNARFEIPAERNLLNIDHLIAQSADDQEIKELKAQKRLLRNRQAALDSRQRKKQHTERLEEEKKQYTSVITDLEDRLGHMEMREVEHHRQEHEWKAMQQRVEQYIQGLLMEKEEMVRHHTLETGDLRKKNAILTDHIQNLQKVDSTAMSAAPSSSGFSADFSDVDSLPVENNAWDAFSFLHDFPDEQEIKQEDALIVPRRRNNEKVGIREEDKPAASGLLLVLLLCGAFVASQSSTNSTPSIPRMPDDIRAASATVLDNIFKDAGVQANDPRLAKSGRVEAVGPFPSSAACARPSKAVFSTTDANMGKLSGSSLDTLNHRLVHPTREQEQEQVFSLSADQYNGITSQEFLRQPEPSGLASRERRDLDSSLAAMREHNDKASAADVYTRSLLWDSVPAEVVREFAKFVSDSSGRTGATQGEDGSGA